MARERPLTQSFYILRSSSMSHRAFANGVIKSTLTYLQGKNWDKSRMLSGLNVGLETKAIAIINSNQSIMEKVLLEARWSQSPPLACPIFQLLLLDIRESASSNCLLQFLLINTWW